VAAFIAIATTSAGAALAASPTDAPQKAAAATRTTSATILTVGPGGAVATVASPPTAPAIALKAWLRRRKVLRSFGITAVAAPPAVGASAAVPTLSAVATRCGHTSV
jgi:hypothetical protein